MKLLKELPRAIIISFTIFMAIVGIQYFNGQTIAYNHNLVVSFLYTMLYSVSLYYANGIVFIYLDSKFKQNRFALNRLIIGVFASFIMTIATVFLLRIFQEVIINKKSFGQFIANDSIANYIVSLIITLIVSLAMHAFYFYKAYNENRIKEQKIIANTANAKFESLKNQIDPHFLFNSLNVLSSLIEENPENAQKFTTSLSKIYRYVLEQKDKDLVTVQEELNFAKTYMNLLKMRFENSLTFELPINFENSEAKVVPLSLQLLLENTVKHNSISELKPLNIKIYIDNDCLVVENNLQKKEALNDRRGVGLQNIISRYAILSKRKVKIEEDNTTFKVYLPILTKQISIMQTENFNENTAYYRAKKRARELKGFYSNLINYCIVIPILIFVNLRFSPQFHWFWFSACGWGFGVLMHAFKVFGYTTNWEQQKINEILNENNNNKTTWK